MTSILGGWTAFFKISIWKQHFNWNSRNCCIECTLRHIKPEKAQLFNSISAAVFNLDDVLSLNLQVEVQNGVFSRRLWHRLKIRTGKAIPLLLLCSSLRCRCLFLPGGGKVSPRKSVVQSACQYDVTSRVSDFQNGEQSVLRRDA